MKRRLHECLRDLDIEDFDAAPEDLLEPLPVEYLDAHAREQKRLRVQKIAQDYLNRGQVPVMLTTRLKGPFTGPWANPWQPREAKVQKVGKRVNVGYNKRTGERSRDRHRERTGHRPVEEERWTARAGCSARKKDGVVKVAVLEREETENAAFEYGDSTPSRKKHEAQDRKARKRETAQEGPEGTAGWLGSRTGGKAVQSNRNVSWRSRPDDNLSPKEYEYADDPIQASSPSQTLRNQEAHSDMYTKGYLQAPIGNGNFHSSYSAPMMISSPATSRPGSRAGFAEAPEEPDNDTFVTAEQTLEPPDCIIQTTPKPPAPTSMRRVSSIEVQRIAECCVEAASSAQASVKRKKKRKAKSPRTSDDSAVEMHADEQIPAVAPLSFSGSFTYRKVGKGKGAKGVTKKTPPKHMDFGSSPVQKKQAEGDGHIRLPTREKDSDETVGGGEERTANDATADAELAQAAADNFVEDDADPAQEAKDGGDRSQTLSHEAATTSEDMEDPTIIAEPTGDGVQHESVSSRLSMYSTQTAFRLAQMGLEEDTIRSPFKFLPSIGGDTPGAQLQTLGGEQNSTTPKTIFREPGPTITPFHAFNAKLDANQNDSVRTIEMSTQDLFAAASPFAPSTIKKVKTTVPIRGSSLRFSVPPHEDTRLDKFAYFQDSRSRTPSTERMPLKDRNSFGTYSRSPYDVASQKSLHMSQTLALSPPPFGQPFGQKETSSVPKLSFEGSIDGDLTFADQFLRNLRR